MNAKKAVRQKRIIWDEQERTLVALAVHEEIQANPDKTVGPSMVMHCSQQVLGERGRTFPNPADMSWVNEMLSKMNSGLMAKLEVPANLVCMLERPIATLDLSSAIKRRLADATFQTIGDLVLSSDRDILGVKFLGTSHLELIKEALKSIGLTTGMKLRNIAEETKPVDEVTKTEPSSGEAVDPVVFFVKEMMAGISHSMVTFAEHYTLSSLETMQEAVKENLALMQDQMLEDARAAIRKSVKDSSLQYMSKAGFKVDSTKIPTKRIVVVGPRNEAAVELRRLYSDRCKKLFIYDGTMSIKLLHDNLPNADEVILMTGCVDHSSGAKVRERFNGTPIMVNHGNTELHSVMENLLG